jgi:hypothetical protein
MGLKATSEFALRPIGGGFGGIVANATGNEATEITQTVRNSSGGLDPEAGAARPASSGVCGAGGGHRDREGDDGTHGDEPGETATSQTRRIRAEHGGILAGAGGYERPAVVLHPGVRERNTTADARAVAVGFEP